MIDERAASGHFDPAGHDVLPVPRGELAPLPEGEESFDLGKTLAGVLRRWPLALAC